MIDCPEIGEDLSPENFSHAEKCRACAVLIRIVLAEKAAAINCKLDE